MKNRRPRGLVGETAGDAVNRKMKKRLEETTKI
jgi:hypothetical protein